MSLRITTQQAAADKALAEAHCEVCEHPMKDDTAYEWGEGGEPGRCWDDKDFWTCDQCDRWTDATPITGLVFRSDGSSKKVCQGCAIEEALEHV